MRCGPTPSPPPYSHCVLNGSPALRGIEYMATPRRYYTPIKVYCLENERHAIEGNATSAGMSASHFLRTVGAGYPVRSILDQKAVQELARVNADQGRLGGLLKALLTNEERFDGYTGQQLQQLTKATLADIKEMQHRLRVVVEGIVGK